MLDAIRFGTAVANKGGKAWGEIPVPPEYAGAIKPPRVAVVNGVSDGPLIYIGAGTHGNEYNSIEATRRVAVSIDPQSVHGAVVFVPVHNWAAFEARTRHTPADDKDLDYCYPGSPSGSPSEVLAHLLFQELVTRADFVLDLHTAARGGWNLIHAMVAPVTSEASARAQELGRLFGARVIVDLEPPTAGHLGETMGWDLDHNLFVQASAKGIPSTIIEFGEGGRLEPDQVELGIGGITNVLAGIGATDAAPVRLPPPVVVRQAVAIRCTTQGLLQLMVKPADRVEKGQLLAKIVSFPDEAEEIRATSDGIILRVATDGMVLPNDRVVVLATV